MSDVSTATPNADDDDGDDDEVRGAKATGAKADELDTDNNSKRLDRSFILVTFLRWGVYVFALELL